MTNDHIVFNYIFYYWLTKYFYLDQLKKERKPSGIPLQDIQRWSAGYPKWSLSDTGQEQEKSQG